MQQKIGVIDLGSNTFNLLIAEKINNSLHRIFMDRIPVKLGSGSFQNKLISAGAIQRALQAVVQFKQYTDKYDCSITYAFATSAIRDAINGKALKNSIENFGIKVEIIDGNKEAELIYWGARASGVINELSLIMDIGGGSTEFIIADNQRVYWKKSYQLGITRLYDLFKPADPMLPQQIYAIEKYITDNISELLDACKKFKPALLVGTAGSFETFADILAGQNEILFAKNIYYDNFNLNDLQNLLQQLIKSDVRYRNKLKGLPDFRRDLIVISSCMLQLIVKLLNIQKISYTNFSLKEGAALYLLGRL
jgi:exopolyphosphatase/guanosine-5'-triphosphate,3'-diphosphate pyrophosphatase